ncbi:MAG: caspase family protein [Alphaproteobacteria bacterium]|nr:caspase family protein [Alphaproteobacteria bacterium]
MRRAGGATILGMVAALVAAVALTTATARGQPAEGPPTRPFLRVDAGFHTEVVNRVAIDGAARIAATASDDKSIRLWSVADGTALGTLRVPIGEEEEGAIYAVALSPDGGTLLAAGHTAYAWDRSFAVYLFDLAGQRLRGRLPGLPAPVNHLAYSADGSRFALALGGRAGIRVHDATNGRLIFADADYQDRATWVAFDKGGRLAATGFDGKLRLYAPDGRKLGQRAFAGGGKPYGLTFSGDGKQIAVGFFDQPRVDVVGSGPDLRPVTSLRAPNTAGGLGAVAWSPDGHIIAGGTVRDRSGMVVLRAWSNGGRGNPADLPLLRDTISDIKVLPDGGTLVVGADPALVKIDREGRTVFAHGGTTLDFREVGERRLALSADGMVVDVQPRNAKAALRLDMAQRTIADAAGPLDPTPLPTAAGLRLTDWRNRADPRLGGRPLALDPEETARSWAAPADGRFLVLGTDYHLRFYAADGAPVGAIRLPATAWGVAITPDGTVIVAALGDGTLRWFGTDPQGRLSERMALLLASDLKRWTAWTPEGFFDHSDLGGKELVGYQLNRAKGEVPDWFSFAQVYRLFYAPDQVLERMRGGDPEGARRRLAEIGDLRERLGRGGPPKVELGDVCWRERERETCRPLAKAAVTRTLVPVAAPPAGSGPAGAVVDLRLPPEATAVRLRYSVADQGGGVGPVDIFIDGRNAGRAEAAVTASSPVVQPVDLGPGLRRIQLRAFDRSESTYAQTREYLFEQAPPPPPVPVAGKQNEEDKRPRMWVIVAGVDKYGPQINQLRFAVADAKAFATIVRERAGDLYREISLIELYDEAATTESIVEAMAEVGRTARFDDTFLLYLSGHGTAVDKRYYFVPQNVESSKTVVEQGLSETALVRGLAGIKARHGMIFLDTCHAGALALDSPGQLAHETGRYMLAAATSVQEALDSYDNKNGVFATAVLRGISGGAVRAGDATVSNFDLGFYVKSTVVKLAGEKHHQQRAQFKVAADDAEPFPIARVK